MGVQGTVMTSVTPSRVRVESYSGAGVRLGKTLLDIAKFTHNRKWVWLSKSDNVFRK